MKRLPGAPRLLAGQVAARDGADLARRTGVATARNLETPASTSTWRRCSTSASPVPSVLDARADLRLDAGARSPSSASPSPNGLRAGGVLASAKHFPGLGRGGHDEDLRLNRIDVPLEHAARRTTRSPFRAAAARRGPADDGLDRRLPGARRAARRCSRRGSSQTSCARSSASTASIVTDDLEVPAIAHLSPERKALAAVRAGNDLLLFCQSDAAAERGAAALTRSCDAVRSACDDRTRRRSIARRCAIAAARRCPCGRQLRRHRGVCFTSPVPMPKMKTHSGAKKRFKVTAKGKVTWSSRLHQPHPREEVAEAQARARSPRDHVRSTMRRASRSCSGRASDPRQALRPRAQEAP